MLNKNMRENNYVEICVGKIKKGFKRPICER